MSAAADTTTAGITTAGTTPTGATPDAGSDEARLAVELHGLGLRYGDGPPVLDGLDLGIAEGEFVSILGASGCGKSSLLNVLAGLTAPTAGWVDVPVDGAALMFQDSALLPWLTAQQNVELALRLAGVPRAERGPRARRLLDSVHLVRAHDRKPHELSGGMRQRVALARALAQDRRLLLMDEPFAALDAITRDLLHDELHAVWRATGATIVFVTHNVREAIRLAGRIVVLSSDPGRIAEICTVTDALRADPAGAEALAAELTDTLRKEQEKHDSAPR
ncbi:ABC transporter ATP-binding protein [Zhihengliuella alba]|uniref:ABC transporter ATP-binding protein n=1 Tax=Zhihengliuella alba TaxID=547018 RepID=A0ABP7DV51_9MICC